jgi:hypothetical protein
VKPSHAQLKARLEKIKKLRREGVPDNLILDHLDVLLLGDNRPRGGQYLKPGDPGWLMRQFVDEVRYRYERDTSLTAQLYREHIATFARQLKSKIRVPRTTQDSAIEDTRYLWLQRPEPYRGWAEKRFSLTKVKNALKRSQQPPRRRAE